VQAYEQYLKGVALMHLRGARILDAIECFRNAIALDGRYAPALAGLANALVLSSLWGIAAPQDIRVGALDAASRALAAGPELAEVHAAAALVAIAVEFDRVKAAREWDRAVALGPADSTIRAARAVFHLCYVRGDFARAEADLRIALGSDPLNQTVNAQLGLVLGFARRPAEAIALATRATTLDPDALFGQWVLILALLVQGSFEEVLTTGRKIMGKFGRNAWIMLGMAQASAAHGHTDDAAALFEELVARSRTGHVQPGVLAIIEMALGRREEAMARWRQAVLTRDTFMIAVLLHAPNADRMRAEPEHAAILREIGWDTPLPGAGDPGGIAHAG
jgi:tetratricopeptide (TPR) repeat protein